MLDALGLDHEEELAYRHLVRQPASDVAELAQATGLDAYDASRVLEELETKGLVAHTGTDRGRYIAAPPGIALGALLAQRQDALRRAQAQMNELIGLYRGAARRDVDVVDVVHGTEAIAQRFAQLQLAATRSVQNFSKHVGAVITREDNHDTERAALARGVQYQAVVERSAFDQPGYGEDVEEAIRTGVDIRVTARLPLRMLIVDRELALVPMVPDDAEVRIDDALIVHPSGVLDGIVALFDLVWDAAVPVLGQPTTSAERDQLDDVDGKVLSMLLAGLTDQTIGVQLGMSLRTVQRRVRQLMDRAGVETRLQLGYEASHRHWA